MARLWNSGLTDSQSAVQCPVGKHRVPRSKSSGNRYRDLRTKQRKRRSKPNAKEIRETWSYPPTAGTTTQTTSRQGARKIRARIRGREVRATVSRFSKRG